MAKMKATYYVAKNELALKEVEIPEVGFEQVKVKNKYCAMCATDAHVVSQGLFNRAFGVGLGHEVSGVIEELGEGADKYGWKIGDKVVVYPLGYCGKCEYCQRGQIQYCLFKTESRFPGFAEYSVCSVNQIYKIPDEGDLKAYSLVEPTTCAIRGIDLANIKVGNNVAISGVGGVGTILLNLILLQGGANVTAIDPVELKRDNALEMGAAYTIDPIKEDLVKRTMEITNGKGFDVIFEAAGVPAAAPPCLKMVANCGTIVFFGVYPMDYELNVNLFDLYLKEARIQTVFVTHTIVPRAIQLMPRLSTDKIIGKIMPLDQIQEVFKLYKQSIYPKILVEC